MPLFLAAYGGIVAIPAYFASRSVREPAIYGVVDPAGVLHLAGETTVVDSRRCPKRSSACSTPRAGAARR